MAVGTVRNMVQQMIRTKQWEQKKASSNIFQKKKKNTEMTAEEKMIQNFREELEINRESEEYSQIYNKMMSGQELTYEELEKLRQKNPRAYQEYKESKMEEKAYERELKNCKTKEEAEQLHINKMNGKLAELKSVVNNPHISKSVKLGEAKRILGETTRAIKVYQEFTQSALFQELPTEEEEKDADKQNEEIQQTEYFSEDVLEMEDTKQTLDMQTPSTEANVAFPAIEDKNEPDKNVLFHENRQVKNTNQWNTTAETEKRVLEEMLQCQQKYFGNHKKTVQIDAIL